MATAIMAAAAPALLAQGAGDPVSESDQLLGVSKSPASAPPAPGVASVDVSLLMLLHPRMQLYNFEAGTFEKEFPAGTTPEGRARMVQERAAQRAAAFERNRARLEELNQQRFEVSQQLGQLQSELNTKIFETKNAAGQTDVAAEIARLEQGFWKNRQSLETQYDKFNEEMLKLQDQSSQQAFMPGAQREPALAAIEGEIMDAVAAVARARGCGTVLNASFALPEKTATRAPEPAATLAPAENFDNPYATFWTAKKDTRTDDAEARRQLASLVSRWMTFETKMRAVAQTRPINQLVLTGGRDLTLDVLAYLLRKHRMPDDRARLLLQTLQTLQRKG